MAVSHKRVNQQNLFLPQSAPPLVNLTIYLWFNHMSNGPIWLLLIIPMARIRGELEVDLER